jgi:N-acetylglucosaminyldiphosphoundecaprenol N-acetyl-beta-D-mannosaminyltransferase
MIPMSEQDDLSRNVYCVLGVPVDAVDLPAALHRIKAAATAAVPFLVSTPNLNLLLHSRTDPEFRESLLLSDLCPPDGIAIVWIARLLGIPIKERAAGSDIFESLKSERQPAQRMRVFLFGGGEGVAEAVSARLNTEQTGFECVGALNPGYGSIEQMSGADIISTINSSNAQFLAVSLGPKKGQSWLLHNHSSLHIPVRASLGATFNFQAGVVRRAPRVLRKLGLEWLWRIREEPYLWYRYAHDGLILLRLLLTRLVPLALVNAWQRLKTWLRHHTLVVSETQNEGSIIIKLSGTALAGTSEQARASFESALKSGKAIVLNLSELRFVDSRFLGLLMMLRKHLRCQGTSLRITGMAGRLARIFRLNGLDWPLSVPTQAEGRLLARRMPQEQ